MTAKGGNAGTEQKGKRIHGHGPQCGDYWGYIKGINGNRKNIIKKRKTNHSELQLHAYLTPYLKQRERERQYHELARTGSNATLRHGWWECKMIELLWKAAW